MGWLRRGLFNRWTGGYLAALALSSFLIASYAHGTIPWLDRRPMRERYYVQEAFRTDLAPVLNAPGRLESAKRTIIRCQLENIAGLATGGASTMLSLIPEGTVVKQGDVLATFDKSNYEEMLRQQEITVEQAKASRLQASLDLDIAKLAVNEYRDGVVEETLKGMEGSLALAKSNLSMAADHLNWTVKMTDKGYLSLATIVTEKYSVSQMQFAVDKQLWAMDLYQRFTQPKTERTLERQVTAAKTTLANEDLRLQRQVDRLNALKKQVEYCTVVAPHDGVLYYYKDSNSRGRNQVVIEEGMSVRQRQELFYLPDLTELEVQMALNESVVNRVRVGMKTKIRFEARPEIELDGEVVSISQFPVAPGRDGEDFRYFMSRVKIDRSVPGLTPGMTTRIDIMLAGRRNVLAVPLQAIRSTAGKKFCYVVHNDDLERRSLELGQDTTALVEVKAGLQAGDLVVLDPPAADSNVQSFSKSADQTKERTRGPNKVASSKN